MTSAATCGLSRRVIRLGVGAALALGLPGSGAACNALVGNGDVVIEDDASTGDATTQSGRDGNTSQAPFDASDGAPLFAADGNDLETSTTLGDGGALSCDGGKLCGGRCAAPDDPGYGCAAKACDPCELSGAIAGCAVPPAPPDAGLAAAPDAGGDADPAAHALSCSVALCKPGRGDCNGIATDGCEVDTTGDLYNCGSCGHDCSRLPHVEGNVSCVAGVCTFDGTACAPGYGVCSTNPDDGCDTAISQPRACGACGNVCVAGTPYCSPTGHTAPAFACTSGCAAGLSLCGASCVDETSDPDHCGACGTVCPVLDGGTPVCDGGTSCSFTCNQVDHLCGSGASAFCAADDDGAHCGVGGSCTRCTAPANATPTCSGGTSCGYACSPGAHACGVSCPSNTDPKNCGSLCGTNCPGPTAGVGAASCSGNACALACTAGQTACGTACVNELTDAENCGGCGTTCGAGQTCSDGQCVCNATTCTTGCCDGSNVCQPAPACVTGGSACATGCPATVPQSSSLLLWLVGDTYTAGQTTWADQSGQHADATCTRCPVAVTTTPNGHTAVPFDGNSYFALSDPGGAYTGSAFTVFVVAFLDATAGTNAQLFTLSTVTGSSTLGIGRSTNPDDLVLSVSTGGSGGSLVASGGWANTWELVTADVDGATHGALSAGGSSVTGTIPFSASVDYAASFLGTDPATRSQTFTGRIAEIIVFKAIISSSSTAAIQSYLTAKYGL